MYPSDPSYLFTALSELWRVEMRFDQRAEDALEILGRATTETSVRARFLLNYLALERMVDRANRSDAARALITEFQERVRSAGLGERESRVASRVAWPPTSTVIQQRTDGID